jgi:hypothetical protein
VVPACLLAVAGAVVVCLALRTPERSDPPPPYPFAGSFLPEPPRQHDPWEPPPTQLPRKFVTATAALFRAGLPDPRGCEYRELWIENDHTTTNPPTLLKTHGWLLPAEPEEEQQRFGICWNGLVYPLVSVGGEADLRDDILLALRAVEEELQRSEFRPPLRVIGEKPGPPSLSYRDIASLKAGLLLRLGEEELARKMWAAWDARWGDVGSPQDPYLSLVSPWTRALYGRTLRAHYRGDDRTALACARALTAIEKEVDAEARWRGLPHPGGGWAWGNRPYLDFLESLPSLLADQERRANDPNGGARHRVNPRDYPDKAERIAALIRDLEEAGGAESESYWWDLSRDPAVAALIAEGEDAVEPLLECLENDTRLTRAVAWNLRGEGPYPVVGVEEPAYIALSGILQTSFYEITPEAHGAKWQKWQKMKPSEQAAAVHAAARAYWTRFKGVPLEERWYQVLADDRAHPWEWLQAARALVRPEDAVWLPARMLSGAGTGVPDRKPGTAPRLRGEVLRGQANPTVTELLERRARRFAAGEDAQNGGLYYLDEFIQVLIAWEGEESVGALREFSALLRQRPAVPGEGHAPHLIGSLIRLWLRRADLGDPLAMEEFASWLVTVRPQDVFRSLHVLFEPMQHYPDHPAVARAAAVLFESGRSPWAGVLRRWDSLEQLLWTPLVRFPPFRAALLRALSDNTATSTAVVFEEGGLKVKYGGAVVYTSPFEDGRDPVPPGPSFALRGCDLCALHISRRVEGAPAFPVSAPESRRDEAVGACAAFLRRYGDQLRTNWEDQESRSRIVFDRPSPVFGRFDRPSPVFGGLDHPATAEEVRRGLAVFSLEGEGNARVWRLPARPLPAKWLTLKENPFPTSRWNPDTGNTENVVEYDQQGLVWQAEEVLKEGRWQRYYGFVGKHQVARVPAEEIEFPGSWAGLSRQLDCEARLNLPADGEGSRADRMELGKPVVVTFRLRNRGGLEQTVPSVYYRAAEPELHPGIGLRLAYAPLEMQVAGRTYLLDEADRTWEEPPTTRTAHLPSGPADRMLAPAEEFTALELDLRDWFDVSRPGLYRFRFAFSAANGGFAEGQSNEIEFTLHKPPEGNEP